MGERGRRGPLADPNTALHTQPKACTLQGALVAFRRKNDDAFPVLVLMGAKCWMVVVRGLASSTDPRATNLPMGQRYRPPRKREEWGGDLIRQQPHARPTWRPVHCPPQ